jgi:DNA-binding helix-hairpin-helix protein with protein kinase domain
MKRRPSHPLQIFVIIQPLLVRVARAMAKDRARDHERGHSAADDRDRHKAPPE